MNEYVYSFLLSSNQEGTLCYKYNDSGDHNDKNPNNQTNGDMKYESKHDSLNFRGVPVSKHFLRTG